MKTVPLFEAKNRLSACARDAQRSPVIITRHGRPYAALVGLDGQDMEAFLVAHHPAIIEAIDRAAEAAKTAGMSSPAWLSFASAAPSRLAIFSCVIAR